VFDIETVKQANQALIETIEESLAIADEGKRARAAATAELTQMEADLRKTLAAASAPTRLLGRKPNAPTRSDGFDPNKRTGRDLRKPCLLR
jgi:hypothetical protein